MNRILLRPSKRSCSPLGPLNVKLYRIHPRIGAVSSSPVAGASETKPSIVTEPVIVPGQWNSSRNMVGPRTLKSKRIARMVSPMRIFPAISSRNENPSTRSLLRAVPGKRIPKSFVERARRPSELASRLLAAVRPVCAGGHRDRLTREPTRKADKRRAERRERLESRERGLAQVPARRLPPRRARQPLEPLAERHDLRGEDVRFTVLAVFGDAEHPVRAVVHVNER